MIRAGLVESLRPVEGRQLDASAAVIDAAGKWVLPGFTELCAELGEPGREYRQDLESALHAAARGGFTSVCASPDTRPCLDDPALVDWLLSRAARISPVRVLPVAAATSHLDGESLTEMIELARAGAVAVGVSDRAIASADVLRRVLEYAQHAALPVFHHPEDASLSRGADMNEGAVATRLGLRGAPSIAESIALVRDLSVAQYTGGRYHALRITTAESVEAVRAARARGVAVTAAVPIAHLCLTEEAVEGFDSRYKLVPPLRSAADRASLREGLERGDIDAVTSDHRPRSPSEKESDFSSAEPGGAGLGTCFGALLGLVEDGVISLRRAVQSLTTGPAAVLGRTPASLREGSAADLVLVDPAAEWQADGETLGTGDRYGPFWGATLRGKVELTLCGGAIAYRAIPAEAAKQPMESL